MQGLAASSKGAIGVREEQFSLYSVVARRTMFVCAATRLVQTRLTALFCRRVASQLQVFQRRAIGEAVTAPIAQDACRRSPPLVLGLFVRGNSWGKIGVCIGNCPFPRHHWAIKMRWQGITWTLGRLLGQLLQCSTKIWNQTLKRPGQAPASATTMPTSRIVCRISGKSPRFTPSILLRSNLLHCVFFSLYALLQ